MSERLKPTTGETKKWSPAERMEAIKQSCKGLAVGLMIAMAVFVPAHAAMTAESLSQFQFSQEIQQSAGDFMEAVGDTVKTRRENLEIFEALARQQSQPRIEQPVDGDLNYVR